MAANKEDHKGGYSREGLFGEINHYDEHGHKVGESRPSFWGGYDDYDAKGHKTGHSSESLFGAGYEHYDNKGNKIGYSSEDFFGGYTHHDAAGHVTGHSDRSVMDLKSEEEIRATGSLYGTSWSGGTTGSKANAKSHNIQSGVSSSAEGNYLNALSAEDKHKGLFLAVVELIGYVLTAAGVFLPFYKLQITSMQYSFSMGNIFEIEGFFGGGLAFICLILGVATLIFLATGIDRRGCDIAAIGTTALTVLVVILGFLKLSRKTIITDPDTVGLPSTGYFLLLIGAIVLGVSCICSLVWANKMKKEYR